MIALRILERGYINDVGNNNCCHHILFFILLTYGQTNDGWQC